MNDAYYPHSGALILNDYIYENYGGYLDTTAPALRQIAYWIAERELSNSLHTFLLPTIVTGTYPYNPIHSVLTLDHTYVQRVLVVRFLEFDDDVYWAVTGTSNVYIALRDADRGLLDIAYIIGNCQGCNDVLPYPYKIQVMYEAGLPTGTANNPDILLSLSLYAKVILNEMIGYGNEAPGDIGVQSFSDQQYQEMRVKLLRTDFGTSAMAQLMDRLIHKYRERQYVGM